nr:hypothetical protein 1634Bnrm3_p030 [Cryptomonas sp.]
MINKFQKKLHKNINGNHLPHISLFLGYFLRNLIYLEKKKNQVLIHFPRFPIINSDLKYIHRYYLLSLIREYSYYITCQSFQKKKGLNINFNKIMKTKYEIFFKGERKFFFLKKIELFDNKHFFQIISNSFKTGIKFRIFRFSKKLFIEIVLH